MIFGKSLKENTGSTLAAIFVSTIFCTIPAHADMVPISKDQIPTYLQAVRIGGAWDLGCDDVEALFGSLGVISNLESANVGTVDMSGQHPALVLSDEGTNGRVDFGFTFGSDGRTVAQVKVDEYEMQLVNEGTGTAPNIVSELVHTASLICN